MNFEEYAAKSLVLTPAGIPVPRGTLCISAAEAAMAAANIGPCVVKAQAPVGKRGKAGGIKLAAGPDEAKQAARQIIGMHIDDYKVERVLVESELQQRAQDEFQAQVRYLSHTEYAERLARLDATVRVVAETTKGVREVQNHLRILPRSTIDCKPE